MVGMWSRGARSCDRSTWTHPTPLNSPPPGERCSGRRFTNYGSWSAIATWLPLVKTRAVCERSIHARMSRCWASLHEVRPRPGPDSVLTVADEQWCFNEGVQPWRGRMLVLTDRRTASAGEGVAWLLHLAFGARIAGSRSAGAVTFGDIVPYLLPRSGLYVMLASR
jgi:hypothetical protein